MGPFSMLRTRIGTGVGRVEVVVAVAVISVFFLGVVTADLSPWYVDVGLRADADALLAFKEGVEDSNGLLQTWNYLQSPCAWPGVECARVTAASMRVVALELPSAMLRGSISSKVGDLSELEVLNLSENVLSGIIPDELCNCHRLVSLDLRRNSLTGFIPLGLLSLLPNLVEFLASQNKLSGSLDRLIEQRLAPESAPCDFLKLLDLGHNLLTGELPQKLSSCACLVEVHLSANYLVGGVPSEYGELKKLETLEVQNNILHQPLPQNLKGCTKLRTLNIADNFITGEIPSEYEALRELRDFDVARNRLAGRIPSKGRWIRHASSFRGNDGLCGSPLPPCTDGVEPRRRFLPHAAEVLRTWFESTGSSPSRSGVRRSLITTSWQRRSTGARWGLGLATGLVTGAVAATVLALITRVVWGCSSSTDELKKPIIFNKTITLRMLTFLDKDDALAGCPVLGQGGNGKVYQVALEEDFVVAIKCVRNPSLDPEDEDPKGGTFDAKQIRAELETLGFIRHRNLVQLLAYVFKSDCHFLVYEFMPGGSLQDALDQMAAGNLTLSWPERHRILCGVVQGLAYLHTESLGSSIVHRDLKPANILLNEYHEAKLGDFGLAAIVPLKATHASTNVLAGTIGFIAPEYHQTMRYSQKSDVYSYGVVVAQLVTGRSPIDNFVVENGGSMGSWLSKALQASNGLDAIDPALQGSGYESEILLAMKIAVFCTNVDPQQRPRSTDVLKMLVQIRNPEPVALPADYHVSADSVDSDTPIMSSSSGPLKFAGSEFTTMTTSSSY